MTKAFLGDVTFRTITSLRAYHYLSSIFHRYLSLHYFPSIQVLSDTNFHHKTNLFFFLYDILLGSLLEHCSSSFFFFSFFSIASCFPPRDSFIRTLSTQCQNKFFLFNHVVTWYYWPVIFFSIIVLLLFLLISLSHHSWLSFSQYLVIFFFYNLWLLPLSLSFSFISFPLTIFLSFSHYF